MLPASYADMAVLVGWGWLPAYNEMGTNKAAHDTDCYTVKYFYEF